MPLAANFSTSQTLGVPQSINFTDTSTGSDAGVLNRRVYIQQSDGTFLVETGNTNQYSDWGYTDNQITLDVLDVDVAALVTVEWRGVSEALLYSKQYTLGFTLFNETYDYQTTQNLAANPTLFNDNNFLKHKSELRTYIDAGNQAVEFGSDIYNAQLAYTAATKLRTNSQYFFNTNS